MARAELRYTDEAKTQQELTVVCSAEEYDQLTAKSGELTRKYYTDGVKREVCDVEWRQFQAHLFGWSLIQRIDEVLRDGVPVQYATEDHLGV